MLGFKAASMVGEARGRRARPPAEPAPFQSGMRGQSAIAAERDAMARQFDAIIVGTGQAGPPLAGRLTDAGWRCAIIERQRFGGTCVNYGCTPTKTLVASARAAYMVRRAADFGVEIEGTVSVDVAKIKRRKDEIAGRSNESITSYVKDMKNAVVFEGHAVFEGDQRLRVAGETIEAEKIFINVGARAPRPPPSARCAVPLSAPGPLCFAGAFGSTLPSSPPPRSHPRISSFL